MSESETSWARGGKSMDVENEGKYLTAAAAAAVQWVLCCRSVAVKLFSCVENQTEKMCAGELVRR